MNDFVRTEGKKLVGDEAHDPLRGLAIYKSDLPEPSPKNYDEPAQLKVNTVRLGFSDPHFYEIETPETYREEAWRWIDTHVALARTHPIGIRQNEVAKAVLKEEHTLEAG